jgi:hypothetical protein
MDIIWAAEAPNAVYVRHEKNKTYVRRLLYRDEHGHMAESALL